MTKKSPISANLFTRFFTERLSELNNVTWPTRTQATHSVILVLVIMLIVGVFLGIIDYGLSEGVEWLLTL